MTDNLYKKWWNYENETEQTMEDNHNRFWDKVITVIKEEDISNLSVMDFGCNQGGFLRKLFAVKPFKRGLGIDLAYEAVEVANKRKGQLPIDYEATDKPEIYKDEFDIVFSISVIYLIENLREHAGKIRETLKDGGVYYATYTDYNGNPSLPKIKKSIDENGAIPMQLHDLDEIAKVFQDTGFSVQIMRLLPNDFLDVEENDKFYNSIKDRIKYEYEQAYIFRFTLNKELIDGNGKN